MAYSMYLREQRKPVLDCEEIAAVLLEYDRHSMIMSWRQTLPDFPTASRQSLHIGGISIFHVASSSAQNCTQDAVKRQHSRESSMGGFGQCMFRLPALCIEPVCRCCRLHPRYVCGRCDKGCFAAIQDVFCPSTACSAQLMLSFINEDGSWQAVEV